MYKFLSTLIIGVFLATSAGEISGPTNELSEQSETSKAVVDEFLIKIRVT